MGTEEEDRHVVRIFPDYTDTVLWFRDPVPYASTGLSPGLIRDLKGWEQSYYDALRPDLEWKSADLARQFTLTGNYLAARVADEIGHRYELKFRSYEPDVPSRRFRATGAARNPRAAAAFDELATNLRAQDKKLVSSGEDRSNADEGWSAFAELSSIVYRPDR